MSRLTHSWYSVDANIMIRLKNDFPADVMAPVWDEIERLVHDGRWRIFEYVVKEIDKHPGKQRWAWLRDHPDAIVPFDDMFNEYVARLMHELDAVNLRMIDPESQRHAADPFVVALALMYEGRDLTDLQRRTGSRTCCVLSTETARSARQRKIPTVCDHYGIPHMGLWDFMRHHDWRFTLDVGRPD